MINFDEALSIVMNSVFETETEVVPFMESVGRILAEDILSDVDMPPFNRSAVDGYACRITDISNSLEIIEVIKAGREPEKTVSANQCSKIMTGAIVPAGSDIVFMVEEAELLPDGRVRYTGTDPRLNTSLKGEDVKKGDTVLKHFKVLKPQDIAVLAAVGHVSVRVKRKPRIGIISTGDELTEPDVVPGISKIRNSNAYQLISQVLRAGGIGKYYGIAPDREEETYNLIKTGIAENDIVLVTGGVSMGDFDFVPEVLRRAGVAILFDKVNVQPGKPTTFGVHTKAVVFGLPGNPVSSFVQFETLVRPFISKMTGIDWKPIDHLLPMAMDYERKSVTRLGWIPVIINNNREIVPVDYHGSAHIIALTDADGLISIKSGIKGLKKGEIVSVRQI